MSTPNTTAHTGDGSSLSLIFASVLLDFIYNKRTDELGLDRTVLSDALTVEDVQHICAVFDLELWEILECVETMTKPAGVRR